MGQIKLTQYIHPYGKKDQVTVELPDEVCLMAEKQVLSCECAPNDYSQVVLYSYPKGADPDKNPEVEQVLFADNGPGEKSPPIMLEKLIRKVNAIINK